MNTLLLSVVLLTAMTFAQAHDRVGSGVGNGGLSVVCRDEKNVIMSSELLDLQEGRFLYGLEFEQNDFTVDDWLYLVKGRLRGFPEFLKLVENELDYFPVNTYFLSKSGVLHPTNDAFPVMAEEGCEIEQVANYTFGGRILVASEIYLSFDELNRAALLVHEAVYAIYRRQFEGRRVRYTSELSRQLTAQLLSTEPHAANIRKFIRRHLP